MMSGSDGQQALRTAFKAVEQRMRLDWSGKGAMVHTFDCFPIESVELG